MSKTLTIVPLSALSYLMTTRHKYPNPLEDDGRWYFMTIPVSITPSLDYHRNWQGYGPAERDHHPAR